MPQGMTSFVPEDQDQHFGAHGGRPAGKARDPGVPAEKRALADRRASREALRDVEAERESERERRPDS